MSSVAPPPPDAPGAPSPGPPPFPGRTASATPPVVAAPAPVAAPATPEPELPPIAPPGPTRSGVLFAVGLAALLTAISAYAGGGQDLSSATTIEIVLQILAGGTITLAILTAPARDRMPGFLLAGLMALLAAYTALSISWAVNPSAAWVETNRAFTYAMTLVAGVALVRLAPGRWAALIAAILISSALITLYAIGSMVFPAWLSPDETLARLRTPFGYWNAVGLAAALGVPACLWWGTRREGHAAARAAAAPLLALLLFTILLAYSRGALAAAVIGAILWFVLVPLRLRSAAVLIIGLLGAGAAAAWTFSQAALSEDKVPLASRDTAGHWLGLLLVAMIIVTLALSMSVSFFASRRPLSGDARRRVGIALIVLVALVPIAVLGRLAVSDRGLPGSISHQWTQLTDPAATDPGNSAGRLTALGSVRSRYWNDGFKIWKDHVIEGAGAGGYPTARPRYRTDMLDVAHAHGFVPQTLADLGLVGMGICLALMIVFLFSAGRAMGGWRSINGAVASHPERIGLVALTATVITYGVHSFVDWTWFVPGVTVPAMLAAGWVAGRGRLRYPATGPGSGHDLIDALQAGVRSPARILAAVVAVVFTLSMAWATWQPLRSADAGQDAIAALAAGKIPAATSAANDARSENPLAVEPLFDLSAIAQRQNQTIQAENYLLEAVRLQPANPLTWLTLAQFQVRNNEAQKALTTLRAALFLDPHSREVQRTFLQARAATGASAVTGAPAPAIPATPAAPVLPPAATTPTPTVKGP